MPMAARVGDLTGHGIPLNPGPGCLTVTIGFMPAWRALPSSMASAVEGISNTMNSFMVRPQMTPADATASLVQISQKLVEGGVAAAANGAPAAAGTAASMVGTLTATNVALTATWTAASVVPGGQPAANIAYTEGIKAAAAAAASAVMASMAGISDMHICPLPVPIPPHGPGFVTKGSTTVSIGNLPAARQGDQVFEACGGSDPIAMGCPTVMIGDSGGGAGAGAGGAGAGAGAAGSFVPSPPSAWQQFTNWLWNVFHGANEQRIFFGKSIVIEGSPEFQVRTLMALATLAGTPSGREILQNIENSGHTVTIKETTDANGYCEANGSDADTHDPTKGTDSTVSWNPNHNTTDPADPVAGSPGSTVILGHELVHAMHNATGTNANGPYDSYPGQSGSSARGEERSTVGEGGTSVVAPDGTTQAVPDYSTSHPTENSLRDDLGIPRRPTYYPSTWPGGPPW
jgi:uncharacterized Zn-binding protein involved in type VI secretion